MLFSGNVRDRHLNAFSRQRLPNVIQASLMMRKVDVAAPQQIIKTADPEPTAAIALQDEVVLALIVGTAVAFGQQVDEM